MARGLASSACKRGLKAFQRGTSLEEPQAAHKYKRAASLGSSGVRAARTRLPARGWAAAASQEIQVHSLPGAWRSYRTASVQEGGPATWKAWREKLCGQLTQLLHPMQSIVQPGESAASLSQGIAAEPLEADPVAVAATCAAVQLRTAEELGELSTAELAGLALSLEAAASLAARLALEPVCTALCARLTPDSPDWDGQAVATVLKACVALKLTPTAEELDALGEAAAANIQRTESVPLAAILASMAHWQFGHEVLLRSVADEIFLTPLRFPSEALINIAYSLCCLERCSLRLMDCVIQRVMPDLERLPASSLSSSSLVDAVCALRLLRPRAGDLMISVFMRRLAALVRPQECSAPQLVDILHAFYSLRHQGLRNGTVLELSFRRILDGHNDLSPEHMVRLAQCLEMHVDNAPAEGLRLLDALARHAACHIADFSPEQLAQLLCAHSAVRHCDEALLARATQRVLMEHEPDSSADVLFTTPQLVDILWASVSLGRQPEDELVELVLSSVLQAPQRLTGECLSRGLWSFGVTERLRNEDYDLMAECLARTQLPEFGPEALQRLYMVELMLNAAAFRDGSEAGPARRLPDNLRRLCAESWQDRLYQNAQASRLQQHICRTLAEMGQPYLLERFIDRGLGIDIVLNGPGMGVKKVAIEADGFRRFTRNAPYHMLGDIKAIQRMLASYGWHVISIAKHEWNLYGVDSRERMKFLQSRIAAVTQAV